MLDTFILSSALAKGVEATGEMIIPRHLKGYLFVQKKFHIRFIPDEGRPNQPCFHPIESLHHQGFRLDINLVVA
jgi:hypothetical protein